MPASSAKLSALSTATNDIAAPDVIVNDAQPRSGVFENMLDEVAALLTTAAPSEADSMLVVAAVPHARIGRTREISTKLEERNSKESR